MISSLRIAREKYFWPVVALVLLCGGFLRIVGSTYGYDNICLTQPEEYWLYDKPQVSSLYAANVRTPGVATLDDEIVTYPRERTALATSYAFVFARLVGALLGLVTVAIVIRVGRVFKSNWWLLAGLFVALAPVFVEPDRWVIRFDPAPLAVALSLLTLTFSFYPPSRNRTIQRTIVAVQIASALSLFLIAPPLWWLAILLVIFQPLRKWRFVVFFSVVALAVFPALQSLIHWFGAASQWDQGATAALLLASLVLGLWLLPGLDVWKRGAMVAIIMAAAAISLFNGSALPKPDDNEWLLIHWLQERIPDGTVVRFHGETWYTAFVARCPMGNNVKFVDQPASARHNLPPDYIVTTQPQKDLTGSDFVYELGNGYFVGRELDVPHPVDIPFGDVLHILSYEVMTPQVESGGFVHLRFDYQMSAKANPDYLRYSAFIHVTLPGQPAEKLVDHNWPLIQEFSVFGPRMIVPNEHYRFGLPQTIDPGVYDLLFGIYDVYSGERLATTSGDTLFVGQIEISNDL